MWRIVPRSRQRCPWWLRGKLVFVSYRRKESAYATGWLCDRLSMHFDPQQVVQDVSAIPAGCDFRDYIETVIPQCMVVLAVIGPTWRVDPLADGRRYLEEPSDTVGLELCAALRNNVRVIPVLLEDAEMPRADKLPRELIKLASLNAVRLRPHPDFGPDVERLISQISGSRRRYA